MSERFKDLRFNYIMARKDLAAADEFDRAVAEHDLEVIDRAVRGKETVAQAQARLNRVAETIGGRIVATRPVHSSSVSGSGSE